MESIEARRLARPRAPHTPAQSAHEAMVSHFVEQVRCGVDETLLHRTEGPVRLSELIGGSGPDARQLLFGICMQALNSDRSDFLASSLASFVRMVGSDWADDFVGAPGAESHEDQLVAALAEY